MNMSEGQVDKKFSYHSFQPPTLTKAPYFILYPFIHFLLISNTIYFFLLLLLSILCNAVYFSEDVGCFESKYRNEKKCEIDLPSLVSCHFSLFSKIYFFRLHSLKGVARGTLAPFPKIESQ